MLLDFLVLPIRQPAAFEENVVPDADFADIVQVTGKVQNVEFFGRAPHLLPDEDG